jgi:hypothetical protein
MRKARAGFGTGDGASWFDWEALCSLCTVCVGQYPPTSCTRFLSTTTAALYLVATLRRAYARTSNYCVRFNSRGDGRFVVVACFFIVVLDAVLRAQRRGRAQDRGPRPLLVAAHP